MAKTALSTLAAVCLAVACGPKESAQAPAATPAAGTAEDGSAEPAAAEPAATSDGPSASEAASGPDGGAASLRQQCEKVCKQVAGKCSPTVAENCEINCDQYDKTPKACEPYAREALTCAQSAKDLPCANVAPESCAKQYRRMSECQRAPDTFEVKADEAKKKLPEGWGLFEQDAFSVPMPGGVTKTTVGPEAVWTATAGKVRYSVRKLPALTEKLTPKSQVRLATEWLKPCTLKMKLHGHVERGDRSSMHYDVGCKDGGERHGMVHITPSALYIVGVETPAGEKAEIETFVYGFALK